MGGWAGDFAKCGAVRNCNPPHPISIYIDLNAELQPTPSHLYLH